jgi:CheY-like chemotaxis protein/nitrogen-specific signal transduction histidine kinase
MRNLKGEPSGYIEVIQDISALKFTTKNLKQALINANAASKAKSNFVSNMSHEMRTPMNAIIGMTAIGKKAKNEEDKNRAFGKIEDASNHLLNIINDVLDMAKIEADKIELHPGKFEFRKMVEKSLMIVSFKMNAKHQFVTVNMDERIPRYIIADDHRLTQVITNLLSNAVKFTPVKGEIELDVTFIEPTPDSSCEIFELEFVVSDNGIGISSEQQDKLFKAFEQAESGTNRKYGGTGLGLVISKSIVERMGGNIRVESEPGKGSRFIFTVKARYDFNGSEFDPDFESDASFVHGEFRGKCLLLAEDIEINREILVSILDETGMEIRTAENGEEAFEMFESAPDDYDIVFMDVQMPIMDGLESTKKIRNLDNGKGKNVPIIALTANVFKSDIEECIMVGMNGHLGKPFDISKIAEILRMYVGN